MGIYKINDKQLHFYNQNMMPKQMTAYLPTRSGSDSIRTVMGMVENANATNEDLFILSADIAAASDTVKKSYTLDVFTRMKYP